MSSPPPPYGQPVYPQEPYPQQPYAQQPYPQQPYPQQPSRPGPPGYAYGPPPGYRMPAPSRRSQPVSGWALLAFGALTILGAVLPWARVLGISVTGTNGDGKLTLFCGLVILATGLVIGLGAGLLWASIVATVFATFVVLIAAVDTANVSRLDNQARLIADANLSVGVGLWLTLGAGIAGLAAAIVAIVRRPVVAPVR